MLKSVVIFHSLHSPHSKPWHLTLLMSFTRIFMLITTQGLCNITFLSLFFLLSLFFEHLGPFPFFMLPFSVHIHVVLLTLLRIGKMVYWLTCYLNLFLEQTQDLVTSLRGYPRLNSQLITQLRGVDSQVSSNDPTGIVHKNMANDHREIWRRPSWSTNCWNRKFLHSFCNMSGN